MDSFQSAPASFKTAVYLFFYSVVFDTMTGVGVALALRNMQSSVMRTKLSIKCAQYFGIMCLGGLISLMVNGYYPVIIALWGMAACEGRSILESLRRLERHGGVKINALSKILDLAGVVLEQPVATVVTAATTIPADPVHEPVINVTSVKRLYQGDEEHLHD